MAQRPLCVHRHDLYCIYDHVDLVELCVDPNLVFPDGHPFSGHALFVRETLACLVAAPKSLIHSDTTEIGKNKKKFAAITSP